MLPTTLEWVRKAESDYIITFAALRLPRHRVPYDQVCFHAQQCVEKYLKARLTEAGVRFPKTHDFPPLLAALAGVEPAWSGLASGVAAFAAWSVDVRYPGGTATRTDAARAMVACREWRQRVRVALGL